MTKTNKEQIWGRPSARQFAQEKYSKGKYFYEMFPPKEKVEIPPMEVELSELKGNSVLRMILLAKDKNKFDYEVKNCMNSLLNQVDVLLSEEICEACVIYFFLCSLEQPVYETNVKDLISDELIQFYKSNILLSEKDITNLCCNTLEQCNCDKWCEARKLRISLFFNTLFTRTSPFNFIFLCKDIKSV